MMWMLSASRRSRCVRAWGEVRERVIGSIGWFMAPCHSARNCDTMDFVITAQAGVADGKLCDCPAREPMERDDNSGTWWGVNGIRSDFTIPRGQRDGTIISVLLFCCVL